LTLFQRAVRLAGACARRSAAAVGINHDSFVLPAAAACLETGILNGPSEETFQWLSLAESSCLLLVKTVTALSELLLIF